MLVEINIDALAGPTHHFGGLGVGNVASVEHAHQASSPRQVALEGLHKAALVASLGVPQYLYLPPVRPRLDFLVQCGFGGSLGEQLEAAFHTDPRILSAAFSGAFIWAANSATVSAATDSADGRTHLTPANLISSWHRAVEAEERITSLRAMFSACEECVVHEALPAIVPLRDEGAANHMRLSARNASQGLNLFVFGATAEGQPVHTGFFPRQTRAACEAIARRHQLHPTRTFFLQQQPAAIAAGVFHNDVIATSHEHLLIHHARAFQDSEQELSRLATAFHQNTGVELMRLEISEQELPLADAVRSYLFNSQIVTPGPEYGVDAPRMVLISPAQCREIKSARKLIDRLIGDVSVPLDEVRFVALEQSMSGGGGPACLRLRVPLDQRNVALLPAERRLDAGLAERLAEAIERWYPATLQVKDFCDVDFVEHLLLVSQSMVQVISEPDGRT